MSITIASKGGPIGPHTRHHIGAEVMRKLKLLDTQFSRAHVAFKDINGPKGGLDKECLIEVTLRQKGRVVVKSRARWMPEAFSTAARKLESAVRRRACRRGGKSRSSRMRFPLAGGTDAPSQ